jgi:hypothetical protein
VTVYVGGERQHFLQLGDRVGDVLEALRVGGVVEAGRGGRVSGAWKAQAERWASHATTAINSTHRADDDGWGGVCACSYRKTLYANYSIADACESVS